MVITVVMKLSTPKMDDTPVKWREKIPIKTDASAWAILGAKGG